MKIKGSSSLNIKIAGIISAVLFAALFGVRLYQSLSLTDHTTGFFTENNFSVTLMYILFALSIIVPIVLFYICGGVKTAEPDRKTGIIYSIAAIIFAVTLVSDGAPGIKTLISTGSFDAAKMEMGGTLAVLCSVFAILGALAVLLSAVISFKGDSLTGKLQIPMLFPVIWAFCKTLRFFSVTISYIRVGQLLITIFATAFLMIFLFENARILTGIGRKEAMWFFVAAGTIAATLCIASAIPALIVSLSVGETASYCTFEAYTLGGGIYALTCVITRLLSKNEIKEANEASDNVTETL